MTNVVIIGMSGSGKTMIGQLAAAQLDVPFVDVDYQIEQKMNTTIPILFKQYGESGFRDIESQCILEVAARDKQIISTGGGAVIKPENIEALKQNGKIIFIDRPLLDIQKNFNAAARPMIKDKTDITKLYYERLPLYRKYADITLPNTDTLDIIVSRLVLLAKKIMQYELY